MAACSAANSLTELRFRCSSITPSLPGFARLPRTFAHPPGLGPPASASSCVSGGFQRRPGAGGLQRNRVGGQGHIVGGDFLDLVDGVCDDVQFAPADGWRISSSVSAIRAGRPNARFLHVKMLAWAYNYRSLMVTRSCREASISRLLEPFSESEAQSRSSRLLPRCLASSAGKTVAGPQVPPLLETTRSRAKPRADR